MAKRVLTIRGSIETKFQDKATEKLLFNYESPDRTRGWKVTGAWIWIDTKSQNTITANNNPVIVGALATDTLGATFDMDNLTSADDSRVFGWNQIHYRGFDTEDYFVPHASTPASQGFLLDLDRIVTNELYLYVQALTNGGLTLPAPVNVNYMVALEEQSLTPSQSILQQLKGIGQDIQQ